MDSKEFVALTRKYIEYLDWYFYEDNGQADKKAREYYSVVKKCVEAFLEIIEKDTHMTNGEKFLKTFGRYATEIWALPEAEFLDWLNKEYENQDMIDLSQPNG